MPQVFNLASAPATSEYVLRVLTDAHRQQCEFDPETDPDIKLTFETTVADWRLACGLADWRSLGRALNSWWQIERADAEWRAVLEPAHERRLSGVCEFIAKSASMPVLPASSFLGAACYTASAFRAIRGASAAAGAPVDQLRPSFSLDPFLRRYPHVFLADIARLAPGALPSVKIRLPVCDAAVLGFICCFIAAVVAQWLSAFALTVLCVLLSAMCYAMIWVAAKCIGLSSVEFGNLKTFRDLAQIIADRRNR